VSRSEERKWDFKQGYRMKERWSRHENSDQYAAFLEYLRMPRPRAATKLGQMLGYTPSTVYRWAKLYNWDERAAAWDKQQAQLVHRDATALQRKRHREAIQEYRDAAERQAKDMMAVSEDLVAILSERIKQAETTGEEIPMALVAGLLRATAGISEQGRQAWAAAIGVDQLMEVVEVELQNAQREREQEAAEGVEDAEGVFEFELDE
jgi:hypothetical protein